VKLSDEKPSRGSVTATMKSREEDTYLIHLLLGRRGTDGTGGTRRTIYFPWGTRRGDRLVPVPFRCVPVPPVPALGTTLIRRKPFAYRLYRLSHLNLEGCRDRTRDSDADRSEFGDGSPADREGPPSQLEPGTGRTQRKWSKFKLTSSYSRRVIRGDQTARGY
jgi:hypothetical protein